MEERTRGIVTPLWTLVALLLLVGGGLSYHIAAQRPRAVQFNSIYQAVLLSNGAVFYGKLDGYGTEHPVLNNVFYILSQQNPETKQVNNVLVRRGKELHGPDRMYLNPRSIVFVEPVSPSSRVAQLINEAT